MMINDKELLKTAAIISAVSTIVLAYMDYETTSFWSIFKLENIPALLIFFVVIGGVTFGLLKLFEMVRKKKEE